MNNEEREVCIDRTLNIEAYRFKGIMQKFPNHFHEYYVIGFIESGTRRLFCKNQEYIVTTGDLLLFNPLDNHTCEQLDDKTLDYRCINIKPEIMGKTVYEITGKAYLPQFTEPVLFHSELTALLKELHLAIMEDQADFEKEEAFLLLIAQLLREHTLPDDADGPEAISTAIQNVCTYIDNNFAAHITLDDLSLIAHTNKYTLLRSFTRAKGITPYRYLETVRINAAKALLEQGTDPVDTAMRTGFSDQSHFTKHFKNHIGLTPKQYKNIFTES